METIANLLTNFRIDIDKVTGRESHLYDRQTVFCTISSITQSEFDIAGRQGLKPELKLEMWKTEYNNQEKVMVEDVVYSVYRTYTSGDKIELYLTRRLSDDKH